MTTIVLLHGAFRGGWAWGRVAARLTAQGHRVVAPDLLGAGRRWRPDLDPIGLETTLDDLEAMFEVQDLSDVVLVGHSQGGLVGEALTQRVPDRLRIVCHLDAPVPVHGERAVDLKAHLDPDAIPQNPPDRNAWVPPMPLDAAALGVPALVAARWTRQLTPLSVAIALDPVILDDPAAIAIPRTYAWCAGTPPFFPAWHTRGQRDAAGMDDPVLDAPHDAPLARPDLVAGWVQERT